MAQMSGSLRNKELTPESNDAVAYRDDGLAVPDDDDRCARPRPLHDGPQHTGFQG
ncbi:MAG: hypothetical protein QOK33_5413, partial [Mycobacterium sp.]|nr:hypothetical protein [Mycobacterium sp.]